MWGEPRNEKREPVCCQNARRRGQEHALTMQRWACVLGMYAHFTFFTGGQRTHHGRRTRTRQAHPSWRATATTQLELGRSGHRTPRRTCPPPHRSVQRGRPRVLGVATVPRPCFGARARRWRPSSVRSLDAPRFEGDLPAAGRSQVGASAPARGRRPTTQAARSEGAQILRR